MFAFKDGVKLNGIKPEAAIAMLCTFDVFELYQVDCLISSVCEGKHSRTSLHYVGYAFDISMDNVLDSQIANTLIFNIKQRLTDEYDVILEWTDSDNDHIHIEFQPKLSR